MDRNRRIRLPLRAACRVLGAAFLLALVPLALSEAAAQEAPYTVHPDDPDLEWAPCPDFIPEGCEVTFLKGDMEQRNADVLFRFPADFHIPEHWHTSVERMVLLSGEFHIHYEGHEPVVMQEGSYAFGPAKLPHDAYCADAGPCHLFVAFEDPVDAVPGTP